MVGLSRYYKFEVAPDATHVFILAHDKRWESIIIRKIPCKNCSALYGVAYDSVSDSFCVDCTDYLDLGIVPISVTISVGEWRKRVPVPDKLLLKSISDFQLDLLKQFKSKFDSKRFSFSFLQAIES